MVRFEKQYHTKEAQHGPEHQEVRLVNEMQQVVAVAPNTPAEVNKPLLQRFAQQIYIVNTHNTTCPGYQKQS
jgi:hypothetical protein